MAGNSGVRTAQLVTTYGVGALVPIDNSSVIVVGLDRWRAGAGQDVKWLHERRLKRLCKVDRFMSPPTGDRDGRDIPVTRFPTMVTCQNCRTLQLHRDFCAVEDNECPKCDFELVPSRFIVACTRGHLDDFPYDSWVHQGEKSSDVSHGLKLSSAGNSASLGDIEISCSCGAQYTMAGAFSPRSLDGIFTCRGRRPWLPDASDEDCSLVPVVLQRGASNVWFPVYQSALCIPPWSDSALQLVEKQWSYITDVPDEALEGALVPFARNSPFSPAELASIVRAEKHGQTLPDEPPTEQSIRSDEFKALVSGNPESDRSDQFVCISPGPPEQFVGNWFDTVMAVKRLKEIKVLESFTRVVDIQDHKRKPRRAALSSVRQNWLPAIEVLGEGVFLQLKEEKVLEWESQTRVIERASRIIRNADPDRPVPVTPRMILVHTLAHVIIDQWALDCGYRTSDLKERLYVGEGMAGVLIYTSSGDSSGSLGGVISQSQPKKLEMSIPQAIARATWCSNDPCCIETPGGFNSVNLGACHACALLPEVSCEAMNSFLDRGLLVQGYDTVDTGFFPAVPS